MSSDIENRLSFFLSYNQMSPKRLPPFLYVFTADWLGNHIWPGWISTYTGTFIFLSQVLSNKWLHEELSWFFFSVVGCHVTWLFLMWALWLFCKVCLPSPLYTKKFIKPTHFPSLLLPLHGATVISIHTVKPTALGFIYHITPKKG